MRTRDFLLRYAVAVVLVGGCGDKNSPPARAASPPGSRAPEGTWLLGVTPDSDFVRADATEASLRSRLGATLVRTDSIYVGEGMSALGTVLFPDDSARRLEILWSDTAHRARPVRVMVSYARSVWRLYPGVSMGTTLRTLDSLNGRAFTLLGFNWDYSGTITSFNGGRLDSLWHVRGGDGGVVLLRLGNAVTVPDDTLQAQVVGDREFHSDHPAMHALNPSVYQLIVRPR